MIAVVEIEGVEQLEAIDPSIGEAIHRLGKQLNDVPADELVLVIDAMNRALSKASLPAHPVAERLASSDSAMMHERVELELELLARSFARRRELLDGSFTTAQVAALLGTSRQTPHDRVQAGTLLAVLDRGVYRFPAWQFDPDGDNGVVEGLPEVIRALDVSPIAKVSWLSSPHAGLDGETPVQALRNGNASQVIRLARAVGLS